MKKKIMFGMLIISVFLFGFDFSNLSSVRLANALDEDSPFGIHAPYLADSGKTDVEITDLLSDLGVKWVRLRRMETGEVATLLSEKSINIVSGIATPEFPTSTFPEDLDYYIESLKAFVRANKDYVKAWLIVNEAEATWKDTTQRYAEYFALMSDAIKSEDPNAQIVLGLAGGKIIDGKLTGSGYNFLDEALKNNIGPYFDVLDIHFQGPITKYKELEIKVSAYKALLKSHGFEKPVWLMEYATYDGTPIPSSTYVYPYQSERTQAAGVVKKYVYGSSLGVKKMFWSQLVERYLFNGQENTYYSNTGLINNPLSDGKSHKKLAYYTYKKMAEVLEGSSWDTVGTIASGAENICIYKFNNQGEPIYVVWWDTFEDPNYNEGDTVTFTFGTDFAGAALVTDAVPRYESGADVTDYNTAFNSQIIYTTCNAELTLTLGDSPVFITEYINCPDSDCDGFYGVEGCGTDVDCDDIDPDIYPGSSEICDGRDNNCDGLVDEGCGVPKAPSNLRTRAQRRQGAVILNWQDTSDNEDGFMIERKLGNCTSTNPWLPLRIMIPADAERAIDRRVHSNTEYSYQIKAFNRSGDSDYSNCSTVTTQP